MSVTHPCLPKKKVCCRKKYGGGQRVVLHRGNTCFPLLFFSSFGPSLSQDGTEISAYGGTFEKRDSLVLHKKAPQRTVRTLTSFSCSSTSRLIVFERFQGNIGLDMQLFRFRHCVSERWNRIFWKEQSSVALCEGGSLRHPFAVSRRP